MEPPKITLAVFFTHGVSLALWETRGMFSREVKFYEELTRVVGEVWLFTYGEHDERYRNRLGPNIRLFPKRCACPPSHYALMLPFVYRKQLRKADLIRIHQVAGAIPALLTHWLFHKPLIVRAGFQWFTFAKRQGASWLKLAIISLIERLAYRSAHAIIHTTQQDADFVTTRYKISQEKIHVIPNWVDTELFKPFSQSCHPEGAQRPKDLEGRVCFVGRLEEQKNLLALVEAMHGVDGTLVLYGEGSQRKELEDAAREHDVDVEFRGRIANEDLPAALCACDIFVLPSFYEGNPKVLLEAMACGLPVVGTDVEGITSIVTHEQTGLICQTNPESIRQAINKLLDDPGLRSRLGEAARESIIASSSLPRAVQTEVTLYLH